MPDRRPAALLVVVCVLLAAAQILAVVPQFHACALFDSCSLAKESADGAGSAAAEVRGPRHGKPVSEQECPVCRIANLVLVMRGAPPASAPSARAAQAVPCSPHRRRWLRLDSAYGRAPPRS